MWRLQDMTKEQLDQAISKVLETHKDLINIINKVTLLRLKKIKEQEESKNDENQENT